VFTVEDGDQAVLVCTHLTMPPLVAAAQLCSSSSPALNGQRAAALIRRAAARHACVVFFPEAADYIAANAAHSLSLVQPVTTSPFVLAIQETLAALHSEGTHIDVVAGVHEPTEQPQLDKRTRNTLLYFNSTGEIVQRYQKIHLFDVDIPHGPILKESNSVQPGNAITAPFDTPLGKLGMAICYDLRFPELALELRRQGAQILTYPSAWTMKTGPHFQTLAKAMAILTQCYVIMPAQKGVHDTSHGLPDGIDITTTRESYGHTCIVDPNGTILAECPDTYSGEAAEEGSLCFAEVDLAVVERMRINMPLWQHRRPDVFNK
jgi:predicted amidohydrolase